MLSRRRAVPRPVRLLAAGEQFLDVLWARARVRDPQGRKTNATDAHSVALVGTRMAGLRPVVDESNSRSCGP
jgi:transposase